MLPPDEDKYEDEDEDEEGEPEGEGWELDPNDPDHPDFDLSEAGYSGVESEKGPWHPSRALILTITLLLLLALFAPTCVRLFT